MITSVDHVAVICSDYMRAKWFYVDVLGFELLAEVFQEHRNVYRLNLGLEGKYLLELFIFPEPPKRVTNPEACGLRHIAFLVENLDAELAQLSLHGIAHEPIRFDQSRGCRFAFIRDPDDLPIELYERK